jgi:leukotriene-A4 hydrolase
MLKNEYNRIDHCSFSNPEEAVSTVLHLEWTLDFDAQQILGTATHGIVVVKECSVVKFDSSSLSISAVEINGAAAKFSYGKKTELGTCVSVEIPVSSILSIHILYSIN